MKLQFHTWSNPKNSFQMELFLLFKPKLQRFIWAGLFLLLTQAANAQVSGSVFRDYNANGVKDNSATFNEPFEAGVTVTAYDAAGTPTATTTDASGAYSFTGLTLPLRIEFSGYQTSDYSAPKGNTNNTSVQFYTVASSAANFGVNYPSDYCQSNPKVAVTSFKAGDQTAATYTQKTADAVIIFDEQATGTSPTKVEGASQEEVAATYGQAYDRRTKYLYTAAFIKRHSGLSSNGAGAIFRTDISNPASPGNPTLWVTIPNVGYTQTNSARGLPANASTSTADATAMSAVGKQGLGDIDISEDGLTLYVMNMNDKSVYPVNTITGTIGTPLSVPDPGCSKGAWRPFGLEVYKGVLYVGGVCDGSGSGATTLDLTAQIFPYNIASGTWGSGLFGGSGYSLDYDGVAGNDDKGGAYSSTYGAKWNIWVDTWTPEDTYSTVWVYRPMPMLTDIEFVGDDRIVMAFRDRWSDLGGYDQYDPTGSGTLFRVTSAGDILMAWKNGASWQLESAGTAGSGYTSSGTGTSRSGSGGPSSGQGPGGGEFFWRDYYSGVVTHSETSQGATAYRAGTGVLGLASMDPINLWSNGINWFNLNNGSLNYNVELNVGLDNVSSYGKSGGLGDFELLCNPAPLEIGNRVWNDADSDGIQDAGEAGIDGITVQLYEGVTQVGTTTTANGGQWYFNDSNVTGGLQSNTGYTIRILNAEFPAGLTLTTGNADGSANGDARDSDANLVSGNAEIAYTTGDYGQNDHTLDMGFRAAATCTLTVDSTVPTACSPATNTYNLAVTVSYADQPAGDITINVGGTNYTFTPDGTSPDTYTVTGLTSNGTTGIDVTATFVGDNACTDALVDAYNAPVSCACNLTATATGTNVSCNGGNNGTATATPSGNLAPVTYLWSNGETTATISGLTAGNYNVTVTESATCMAVQTYEVTQPTALAPTCTANDVTTTGGSDGTAGVTATGGTAPYSYLWTDGETTASISSKTAGTYTVTVTDNNGCTAVCNSTIQEPGCNLSATTSGTPVSCNGGTNGTATATPSGNLAPVTYLWSNGETTATISGLTAGTYSVTVTESATCMAVQTYEVTQPTALAPTCTANDVTTTGGSDGTAGVTATGGTAPYTYLWTDGETTASISSKTAGTYTVTVTDNNGCTAVCNSTIQEPGCNLSATTSGTPVSCNGGTNGTATATPSGNLAPVTYLWSNGETTATISGLTAGTYNVTVTESATCMAVQTYEVTQPTALAPTCTANDVTTTGGSDGTAGVTATGGTAPYSYLWTDGETTASISSKTAGTYTVTVTDNNGCTAVCNSTIQEPGCNLSATTSGTPVSCNGGTNGTATATPSGNLAPVTYLWSNGETTATISGLTAGTYNVTVTESATCMAVQTYEVTQPTALAPTCTANDVTTTGGSDGTAGVTATGGTAPYSYLWTDGETTASISSKTAGTYTVTVTDNNGCTAVCNSTIQEPGALCNLTAAGLTAVMCNDNSTSADAADDYITFTINPTGTTLGSSYVVTVSSGSVTPNTGTYGSSTPFQLQNGSAGSGSTVTITITDGTDTNCKVQVDVADPGSCSTPTCPPVKCLSVTMTKQ